MTTFMPTKNTVSIQYGHQLHSAHEAADELTYNTGPVVRTGPNELSFSSPYAAKDIFDVGKGVSKTDFYWVFPPAEPRYLHRDSGVETRPDETSDSQALQPGLHETDDF
jgi:hypothetical protein